MEIEAEKVIEKLKLIIAEQAGQLAFLQAMIEKLESKS